MNQREALGLAVARLTAVSATPRLDGELLMASALGLEREEMLLHSLEGEAPERFATLVERRLANEPIAYITGRRDFWTISLEVGPGVLIPRPDSETLIEAAIEHFDERAPATILDLGTGPGTLLLAALDQWPRARGLGVDASEHALDYARINADHLGMANRAEFRTGDWAQGVEGPFDLILANPPYIGTHEQLPADVRDHDPGSALFAGIDGLDDYRRIMPELPRLLAPGGAAILEVGWTQAKAVSALALQYGLLPAVHNDLGNRPRAVLLT